MLTATYALVAMSIEQTSVRMNLSAFQKNIRCGFNGKNTGGNQVEAILFKLNQLHKRYHSRKVDIYLIPAVRGITESTDFLLAELESLSYLGINVFRSIQERLELAIKESMATIDDVYCLIDLYCNTLLKKMEKEEQELFDLARKILPNDRWYSIAEHLFLHDTEDAERKKLTRSLTPLTLKDQSFPDAVPPTLLSKITYNPRASV